MWNQKILGHEKILRHFEILIKKNNFPHACVLVGPDDIGKFRISREIAKFLQCENNFCGYCDICKKISKNIFPEVLTIGKLWKSGKEENFSEICKTSNFDQSHRQKNNVKNDQIGIEDVKKILDFFSTTGNAKAKIAIIKNAERMTNEAANSILKILEEPPKNGKIILTSKNKNLLLQTIISRVKIFNFSLISEKKLEEFLINKKQQISDEQKRDFLLLSQGRSEYLFRLLENPDFFEFEKEQFHNFSSFFQNWSFSEKIDRAEKISAPENFKKLEHFLENFLRFMRSILLEKISAKNFPIAQKISFNKIINILEKIKKTQYFLKKNINRRILLENLFFEI